MYIFERLIGDRVLSVEISDARRESEAGSVIDAIRAQVLSGKPLEESISVQTQGKYFMTVRIRR